MFTAVTMTLDEIRQGLVLRFTDGARKFELVREERSLFRLNSVKDWGDSLKDPIFIEYDDFNGCLVGTCKGIIDSTFINADASLPELIAKFFENERIFKEIFRI